MPFNGHALGTRILCRSLSPDEMVLSELKDDAESGLAALFLLMSENEEDYLQIFTSDLILRLQEKLKNAKVETKNFKSIACFTLYQVITEAVAELNRLACKHPELWREIAGVFPVWPVLLSQHPSHNQTASELVKMLHVGGKHSVRLDKGARLDLEGNPFNIVALQLLRYLESSVGLANLSRKPTSWRREAAMLHNVRFSKDTWKKWWAVAKKAFLEAYPHPEEIKILSDRISQRPSQMHRVPSRITEELKEAFQRLAAAPPAPPK